MQLEHLSALLSHSWSIKTRGKRVDTGCHWALLSSTSLSLSLCLSLSLSLSIVDSLILLNTHPSCCHRCWVSSPCALSHSPPARDSGPYMAGPSGRGATGLNILWSSKNAKLLQLTCQREMLDAEEGGPTHTTMGTCARCLISISVFCILLWSTVRCTQEC